MNNQLNAWKQWQKDRGLYYPSVNTTESAPACCQEIPIIRRPVLDTNLIFVISSSQKQSQPFNEQSSVVFDKMRIAINLQEKSLLWVADCCIHHIEVQKRIIRELKQLDNPYVVWLYKPSSNIDQELIHHIGQQAGFKEVAIISHPDLLIEKPELKIEAWNRLQYIKKKSQS
ncbi:MAG: hypothetical protein CMP10_13550 [Zetaproteobacteria bacterium]|nr:hypothetical protein [Pseudobdellovibrionaceae bacterium]